MPETDSDTDLGPSYVEDDAGNWHVAPSDGAVDEVIIYPPDGTLRETAQALLDAAEKLGLPVSVVRHDEGTFVVPGAVAKAAKSTLPTGPETDDEPAKPAKAKSTGKASDDAAGAVPPTPTDPNEAKYPEGSAPALAGPITDVTPKKTTRPRKSTSPAKATKTVGAKK